VGLIGAEDALARLAATAWRSRVGGIYEE
jgi:hypothetical protein